MTCPNILSSRLTELMKPQKDLVFEGEKFSTPRLLVDSGSFGRVFKLKDETVEKETDFFYNECDDLLENNIREANFHSSFPKNKNIIPCNSVEIKSNNILSFIMPFEKLNLKQYIKTVDTSTRILHFYSILSQLCEGLSSLHSNNIYHNDIKPKNIMINPITMEILIVDFGSIRFEQNLTIDTPTTLSYAPPEFFETYENYENLTPETKFGSYNDMWSLGITMLEFLTGENRVESLNNEDEIGKFINRLDPFPIKTILKDNKIDINDPVIFEIYIIISKMLIRNINERISFPDLYFLLNHKNIPLYIRTYPENEKIKHIKPFKRAISCVIKHIKLANLSSYSHYYSFELAISICNRYCIKTKKWVTPNLIFQCLHIANALILDGCSNDFIIVDKKKVTHILKTLNFDIYRPTLASYIQKINGTITFEERIIVFDIITNVKNLNKSIDELFDIFSLKTINKDIWVNYIKTSCIIVSNINYKFTKAVICYNINYPRDIYIHI